MFAHRVLKYINLSIAVAAVVTLAAAYWLMIRVLPKTSGTIKAPVSEAATIARDSLGVPHIRAKSLDDALFLQGFATAQDRLWQMDVLRRLASGQLAEVVGKAALESDQESRQLRSRRIAEDEVARMTPENHAAFAAYARGVNFFLETHRGSLPFEFTLLRYDPRPWTIADSLVIGLHMFRTLSTSWREEVRKRAMLTSGDRAKVETLLPLRTGQEVVPGSNAWAISGSHTASGKPLLANDPHLEFSNPSTWYMVHLQSPQIDVSGVSLPGIPCVLIGHNQRIAWGITNLGFDVQDLYLENIDPATGRYVFQGQWQQARLEHESIPVRDAQPVAVRTWITRHGPIFLNEGARYFSLRWVAAEPGSLNFVFVDINRARNWQEFRKALAGMTGPAQNFVYADVDGNIGYQVEGKLPIRNGYHGDLPVDGPGGESEWQGFIPFDQLPSIYNPPSGVIVTANQNPFASGYPYDVNGGYAPYYRSRQIHDMLSSKQGWRPEDMLIVQKDVYSAFARFLAGQFVTAFDKRNRGNAKIADAVALFRNWDGQMKQSTGAPFLIALAYQHFRKAVAERAAPGKSTSYDTAMSAAVIENLLRTRPPGWFDDYDAALLHSLADAIDEAGRMQGRNPRKWDYGAYSQVSIPHPIGQRIPLIGSYFNIGPLPMSGSSTSVKQTTKRLGPSMRMVADLSDWDRSLNNITIGESGQFLSSHYKDQWDAYYNGRSFPMQFSHVEEKSVLKIEPE